MKIAASLDPSHSMEGSYSIQFDNEVVTSNDRIYSSYSSTHKMTMPAVLTHIIT